MWTTLSMALFMVGYCTTVGFAVYYMKYIFGKKETPEYRHCFTDEEFNRILITFRNFFEIMLDYKSGRTVKLGDITPEWWIK
jgi:hypothetical protein